MIIPYELVEFDLGFIYNLSDLQPHFQKKIACFTAFNQDE